MSGLTRLDVLKKNREHFSQPSAVFGYDGTSCVYRGNGHKDSNVRCAFGVVIPDDVYRPVMENIIATAVVQNHEMPDGLFSDEIWDGGWMNDLQGRHDRMASERSPISFWIELLDSLILVEESGKKSRPYSGINGI